MFLKTLGGVLKILQKFSLIKTQNPEPDAIKTFFTYENKALLHSHRLKPNTLLLFFQCSPTTRPRTVILFRLIPNHAEILRSLLHL